MTALPAARTAWSSAEGTMANRAAKYRQAMPDGAVGRCVKLRGLPAPFRGGSELTRRMIESHVRDDTAS
jgi:hypothetical protein